VGEKEGMMPGPVSAYRGRLFKAVHAEAQKRKMDHDALRDMCRANYKVHSMSDMTDAQLLGVYRQWTGKTLVNRGKLPRKEETGQEACLTIVSGEDLVMLDQEFAKRGISGDGRANFIRRQLRGRDIIRTRKDYVRVMGGVRAMNRRECVL
jgi:hypothetical protein